MIRFDRFDLEEMPKSPSRLLLPIVWAGSLAGVIRHRTAIRKTGVSGLKPPVLILGNHNSMLDFKVCAIASFPHLINFVISIDGFIRNETILRKLGVVCKRKFTTDPALIPQLKRIVKLNSSPVIYPEAKLSLDGTASLLPSTMGKTAKLLKVPVVLLLCHGNHIADPCWRTGKPRGGVKTEAEYRLLFTKEQTETLSEEELNEGILRAFTYDDYQWQRENRIRVNTPDRAEGLHKVLYRCPHCGTEYKMISRGTQLRCESCGATWTMDEYGVLHSDAQPDKYPHIPDWFAWEREMVKQEVETGTYSTGEIPVVIQSIPSSDGFILLGSGIMIHDAGGFRVMVTEATKELAERPTETREMNKSVTSSYTCHVVFGKDGDCVDLNTLNDTWYIYPKKEEVSVTKIMLAAEELYKKHQRAVE